MRRDAVENRRVLIEAGAEVFREEGVDVALDAVAMRAGVGIGTLYRHFAHRGDLMLSILNMRLESYAVFAREHPGGASLVVDFLQFIGEGISIYAVAAQFIHLQSERSADYGRIFARFDAILDQILDRARKERVIAEWVTPVVLQAAGRMLVGIHADARIAGTKPDVDTALRLLTHGMAPRAL